MQTLKTAVVVVLLLVVFYGVYEMLNRPPDAPPLDQQRLWLQWRWLPAPIQQAGIVEIGAARVRPISVHAAL